MPSFRRQRPEPETVTTVAAPAPSARERYDAAVNEQNRIQAIVDEHKNRRNELLKADDLDGVRALKAADDELNLRLEQLATRLPAIVQDLNREQAEAYEAAWQSHRPGLTVTEVRLAAAIVEFTAALVEANTTHVQARGFNDRLREFVRPPPLERYNHWALTEYVRMVEARHSSTSARAAPLELWVEPAVDIPPAERFQPRRVPYQEIEAISPIAPPCWVRIVHGPVRTANLNVGIARMFAHETHIVPARAGHALVASGVAEYLREDEVPAGTTEA